MIDTTTEKHPAILQTTGTRFRHILLLDDRVGKTLDPLNISYTRVKGVSQTGSIRPGVLQRLTSMQMEWKLRACHSERQRRISLDNA
jgi:hypothetical protein